MSEPQGAGPVEFGFVHDLPNPLSIEWRDPDGNARRVLIAPGEVLQLGFAGPCAASAFIDAARDEVHRQGGRASMPQVRVGAYVQDDDGRVLDGTTPEAAWTPDSLRRACGGRTDGEARAVVPPAPEPDVDPSQTDVPPDRRTAEDLNPPAQRTRARIERRPPQSFESSGIPTEDYFRPHNPMPEPEIAARLAGRGVPATDLDAELEAVRHNEPVPGQPHPHFGQDASERRTVAADPVDVFSGQYFLSATDLRIPSRGFPIELRRVYRSGAVYYGPWGYNWDHNYNVYLRELSDGGLALWTGRLVEHVHRLNADASYEPPTGVFARLQRGSEGRLSSEYVLEQRAGLRLICARPDGWPHPVRIPLVRVEDANGNAQALDYDAEGRLHRVSDHAGRFIELRYGACGLLESIVDHTGRVWNYLHDTDLEHLVAVTRPATRDTPHGLTVRYEYDRFRRHPALVHNLVRVLDPVGRALVENEYGTDPDTYDFGRVVRQTYGGSETTFHASNAQYVPRVAGARHVPALRVGVTAPDSHRVYTFNYRGDVLDERFRLVKDRSFRLVARTCRYDSQGNLVERREPNGLGVLATYDHENRDPRARGNLLRLELLSPPAHVAGSRLIAQVTYEPRFQRIKTCRDEAGTTVTFVYDYEETAVSRGNVVRIEHPPAELPDGTVQRTDEHLVWNDHGQLREWSSAEGRRVVCDYYGDGPSNGYLRRQIAGASSDRVRGELVSDFQYDELGNLSAHVRGGVALLEYEYDALGRLVRLLRPAIDGRRGEVVLHYGADGQLAAVHEPRGRAAGDPGSDVSIRHEFELDEHGHLKTAVYAANTAAAARWRYRHTPEGQLLEAIDPAGRRARAAYDERRRLLSLSYFAGASEQRLQTFEYDINGNLRREVDASGRAVEYRYDAWDRLVEARLPPESDAPTVVQLEYTARDRLERVALTGAPAPRVAPELLLEDRYEYDALGRLFRHTQGQRTSTVWHDRDSNPVRLVDQRSNAVSLEWDSLGRLRSVLDPIGNRVEHGYDGGGHHVHVEELDVVPGRPPERYVSSFAYDARGRLVQSTDALGNVWSVEHDDRDLPIAKLGPDHQRVEIEYDVHRRPIRVRGFADARAESVEHRVTRDHAGRVTRYVDPTGSATRFAYEPNDRLASVTYADGSSHHWWYDRAGRLERERKPSGTQISYEYSGAGSLGRVRFEPGPGVSATDDVLIEYDGLGRAVSLQQGPQALVRSYDEQNRLVIETSGARTLRLSYDDQLGRVLLEYPDGRVDRLLLDGLGRLSSVSLEAVGSAALTGPGTAVASTVASYEYAGQARVFRRVLASGAESRYVYDAGRRLAAIEHLGPGSSVLATTRYVHDASGRRRVVWSEPSPNAPAVYDVDRLSRLIRVAEPATLPAPPSVMRQSDADAYLREAQATTSLREQVFSLDHADTRTRHVRRSIDGESEDVYTSNALHQVTEIAATSAGETSSRWYRYDRDGNRSGDVRHDYTYDALDRLVEIRASGGGEVLMRQRFDPIGRAGERTTPASAEHFVYWGLRPIERQDAAHRANRQWLFGALHDELVVESAGTNAWSHQDASFSRVVVTDDAGLVVERFRYDAFGRPSYFAPDGVSTRPASELGLSPIFGGHPELPVGLYDMRARVYDSATGTFLQRDSQGFADSPSPYAYVGHSPVDHTDQRGEWVESAWDVFSLGLGIYSFVDNVREGNVWGAALDGVGIGVDLAALVLPIVPGGAGAALRAFRTAAAAGDVLQHGRRTFTVTENMVQLGRATDRVLRSAQAVNGGINIAQGTYYSGLSFSQGNYGSGAFQAGITFLGMRSLATRAPVLTGHRTFGGDELVTRFRGDTQLDVDLALGTRVLGNPNPLPNGARETFEDLIARWRQTAQGAPRATRLFESVTRSPVVARLFGASSGGPFYRFQVRRADLLVAPYPGYHLSPNPLGRPNAYEAEQFVRGGTEIFNPEIVTGFRWSDYAEVPITWVERASIYSTVAGGGLELSGVVTAHAQAPPVADQK